MSKIGIPFFFCNEGGTFMDSRDQGLNFAFFFCQKLDNDQDLNRRPIEKELGSRVRFFPLPCSGRIESLHLMKAIEAGADKVYVITCPEGSCRHKEGNIRAGKRVAFAQRLIEEVGLEPERFELIVSSALPSPSIDRLVRDLLAREVLFGPSPLGSKRQDAA
jgi:F420-non-reducing hydrogenase iron-sulfur subunit